MFEYQTLTYLLKGTLGVKKIHRFALCKSSLIHAKEIGMNFC